jgi:hypothetical protein
MTPLLHLRLWSRLKVCGCIHKTSTTLWIRLQLCFVTTVSLTSVYRSSSGGKFQRTGPSRGMRKPSWMNDEFSNPKQEGSRTVYTIFIVLALTAFIPSATLIMKNSGGWCTQRLMLLVVAAFVAFAITKAMVMSPSTKFPTNPPSQQPHHFLSGSCRSRSIHPFMQHQVCARKSCKW